MVNKDTCYYCNRTTFKTAVVTIDADICHEGDDWYMTPLKEEVGLCQEHFEAWENGELNEREEQ